MARTQVFLGFLSLGLLLVLYKAASQVPSTLSPQGCRMSYMSPSYLLQSSFNRTWTHLADRYSLWLYREVGWEDQTLGGVPVLFIPGNAGSSRQARSIASSATRQYYESPHKVASEFAGKQSYRPLDLYTLEFNEDLSAFHGPTLESEAAYTEKAITYILSLYPPNTSIVIMAHSMGGVVATSLLPNPNIAAIITMSTPHTLPPARFDRRIAKIYESSLASVAEDMTPILSLCGGATDMMIPSESCVIPDGEGYRKTVFTTALEGCWTGVGHQVMVWCHQVRWRVARAALELGAVSTPSQRIAVLDRWLNDGHSFPHHTSDDVGWTPSAPVSLALDEKLTLKNPREQHTYFLPIGGSSTSKFILYLSQGSIMSVSLPYPLPLSASVRLCRGPPSNGICETLMPTTLRLLPTLGPDRPAPPPSEGIDESEGVVYFAADIPEAEEIQEERWVAVDVRGTDGRGWLQGGFIDDSRDRTTHNLTVHDVLHKDITVSVQGPSLRKILELEKLSSNALLAYRLTPKFAVSRSCHETLLPPLLELAAGPESHFYSLTAPETHPQTTLVLHAHNTGPFIQNSPSHGHGMNLSIYSTLDDGCTIETIALRLDYWGTLGNVAARYWVACAGWTVGVVLWVIFDAWAVHEQGASMPTVGQSLESFMKRRLPLLTVAAFFISLIPMPVNLLLGNSGQAIFSPIAPVLLILVTGMVCISWWLLSLFMWPFNRLQRLFARRTEDTRVHRRTAFSMLFIFALIFVFVPWQIAFLGCYIFHFFTCATDTTNARQTTAASRTPPPRRSPSPARPSPSLNIHQQNTHILLLMTWLLPLVAPVLAVWVRTLATAGLTTPFDGDHNVWAVAPWLILVDYASWTQSSLLSREQIEPISLRWLFLGASGVAFMVGAGRTYRVFDGVWVAISLAVMIRIGPRYWGGQSWPQVIRRGK